VIRSGFAPGFTIRDMHRPALRPVENYTSSLIHRIARRPGVARADRIGTEET